MDFQNPLDLWWLTMVLLNVAGVIVYLCLCLQSRHRDALEPQNRKYKSFLRICGGIFLFVSFYRSIFVSSYPNRLSWFPTMLNSPLVIRMLATCAELCFALLVMVPVLHENREMPLPGSFSRTGFGNFLFYKLPYGTFLCLFTAQFFAYGGLFTQHLTLFAIEETLWALGFFCIAPAAIAQAHNVCKNHGRDPAYRFIKIHLILLSAFTVGYLIYQVGFSLPFSYYSQLAADLLKPHMNFRAGITASLYQFTATHDFETWGGMGFFIWHTGYFSICTWLNLLYALGPRKQEV